MSLSIQQVRTATPDEWDELWGSCSYGTYFQSREWAEIWEEYTTGKIRPLPIMVAFSDGIEALWPLSVNRRYKGLIREYQSSPGGTVGGWLSVDSLTLEHAGLLARYFLKKYHHFIWRLNPYDSHVNQLGLEVSVEDETQAIDLKLGFDAVFKSWSKGHRSAVKKAAREGVWVRRASSLEDWREYYRIYRRSLMRWGEKATSQYGWELFECFVNRASSNVQLWLSVYDETIVAGALCFYAKNHVVYWHGAALDDYFSIRPVNHLISEIVKELCESGCRWFDFNPSGGHDGVRAFKKSFGTKDLKSDILAK